MTLELTSPVSTGHLPVRKNKFTHAMFLNQFLDFIEHCDSLQGKTLLMGDFNVHFDDVDDCNTKRFCELLDMFSFSQSVVGPTHKHGQSHSSSCHLSNIS
eukprot:TRINITY_DN13961_c0_g1_i3.p1 TRINITY_DN13961_c0_g1~~TRINITY_DN13961_c0_g1_i3.p1  ORF type:complete len:100 (+),score=15.80 TRINITY_DN13961_c0_g1_i3:65-364(+)